MHRTTDGNVTVLDPGPTAASLRLDIDPVDYFVGVTAGPVAQFVFPVCACDACDETVEPVADDLEATVFAVVAGHLRQRIDRPRNPWWAPQHSPGTQRGGLVIELGGEHPSSSWSLLDRAERRRIQALLRATPDHEVGLAPKTFTDPPLCAATVDRRALRRTHHQHRQPVPTAGCRGALSRTSPCCLRRGPRHRQHRTGTDHRRRPEHRLAHLTPVIRRNGG